jgi:HEAT repeat protein
MTSLTSIAAELRGSIGTSTPQIIDLLQHSDSDVREAAAETLLKLWGQGR